VAAFVEAARARTVLVARVVLPPELLAVDLPAVRAVDLPVLRAVDLVVDDRRAGGIASPVGMEEWVD
jgi:hypothetical protein